MSENEHPRFFGGRVGPVGESFIVGILIILFLTIVFLWDDHPFFESLLTATALGSTTIFLRYLVHKLKGRV